MVLNIKYFTLKPRYGNKLYFLFILNPLLGKRKDQKSSVGHAKLQDGQENKTVYLLNNLKHRSKDRLQKRLFSQECPCTKDVFKLKEFYTAFGKLEKKISTILTQLSILFTLSVNPVLPIF